MNRPKALFFDMDGTLADSVGSIGTVCNRILKKYGFPEHQPEEYKRFVGRGIRQAIQNAVGKEVEESLLDKMFADFVADYERDPFSATLLYPGMEEVVREAAEAGILCFIVTNKAQPIAQKISDRFFGNAVKEVIGFRDDLPPKPAPDGVRLLLKRYHLTESETLFIGDSEVDYQTARNSGVPVAVMTWGYADPAYFCQNRPDFLCGDAAALKNVIFPERKG